MDLIPRNGTDLFAREIINSFIEIVTRRPRIYYPTYLMYRWTNVTPAMTRKSKGILEKTAYLFYHVPYFLFRGVSSRFGKRVARMVGQYTLHCTYIHTCKYIVY